MDRETRAKMESLTASYENRILFFVSLMAIVFFLAASIFTIHFFTREAYNPAKGDRPLATYQIVYYGKQYTQIAAWVDKDGNKHYPKGPVRFAGIDVSILVLPLLGLGIAKGSCDLYNTISDS